MAAVVTCSAHLPGLGHIPDLCAPQKIDHACDAQPDVA